MTQLSLFPPAAVPASPPGVSGAAGQLGDAAAEVGAAAAGLLPDQAARDRIRSDLETSLLVEAGAGAGKTTEMVGRMVALVRCDKARVDQLAAVTFTRKAAAELRQRFQVQLEVELRRAQKSGDGPVLERVDRALKELDRGFIGTIHSFCARLLRERPLEAGLDPAFRELQAVEADRLARDFWMRHLERLAAQGDALLLRAAELGMRPGALFGLFRQLSDNPDVAFPGHPFEAPDPEALRAQLEQLLDRAIALLPEAEPRGGWDAFQTRLRSLRFHRALGWHERARLFEALAELQGANFGVRRERWGADPARAQSARELAGELAALAGPGGPVERLLQQWYAHRYPYALELALRAAAAFSAERRRSGRLDFQDLLMLAARLLREHPAARRALAERYPCLLVDEFQDTDPIQAEVLFLLAARDPDAQDWRLAEPRAGALFVVGDPKQSIYRFRRADIAIYNQVKRRFQEWGAVVELTSNFRSTRPIEQFVNQVFAARFPAQATDHQAAFAWLRAVRPDPAPEGGRGAEVVGGAVQAATRARVCWYEFPAPASTRQQLIAAEDAELVASWIYERIEQGERRPGDFLVLTQRKGCLAIYARALEARNLPVQVTGGGIGIEEELEELARLLRALADPGDPTLTVAVLTGLFFGLDHEQLAEHALAGRGFRFDVPPAAPPGTPVQQALGTLHEFWQWTRSQPADAAVAAIVDHLGLLPYAASGELGESRAGALTYALDAVRTAVLQGETSLLAAVAALEAALEVEDAETPLEPGREQVVRVMNLHKAKGLEAPVVMLAFPTGAGDHEPDRHIVRPAAAPSAQPAAAPTATGYLLIQERDGDRRGRVLARPLDWDNLAGEERRYAEAEKDRLLYVAVTRAAEELVISRCARTESKSPWRLLYPVLQNGWERLEIVRRPPPPRKKLEATAEQIQARAQAAEAARKAAAEPSWKAVTVTALARAGGEAAAGLAIGGALPGDAEAPGSFAASRLDAGGAALPAAPAGRGAEWGTAVHAALEAAARGEAGERLRSLCRGLLVAAERPLGPTGEPEELEELLELVRRVGDHPMWQRARQAERVLVEVPFADPRSGAAGQPLELYEGIIDLVFREPDGWVLVDYKTDAAAAAPGFEARQERYRRQVDLYAEAWERLTGERVKQRILLYTAGGDAEVW